MPEARARAIQSASTRRAGSVGSGGYLGIELGLHDHGVVGLEPEGVVGADASGTSGSLGPEASVGKRDGTADGVQEVPGLLHADTLSERAHGPAHLVPDAGMESVATHILPCG